MTDNLELFDALPDISALLDGDGRIVGVNEAWRAFCRENGGDTDGYYVDQNYIDICLSADGESDAEASVVASGLRKASSSGHTFRCEYPCHSPTTRRWFELCITPFDVSTNRYLLVSHHNITTRYLQQEEVHRHQLQASELAALVATSSDAILSFDLDGNIRTWNRAAEQLYGYSRGEIVGRSMEMLYPDDWPHTIKHYRDRIIAGDLTHFDVIRRTKTGELKNISISAAPVRDEDGEIVFISNIHRDITERIATEEQLRLITRELTHRTKNMFAVVSAIERQTAQSAASLEEFHDKFSARLRCLMASNELLVSQDWKAVPLHDLAKSQLDIFASEPLAGRISVSGPPVMLQPEAVQAIGLGLHELATNAAKYGALTSDAANGKIHFDWTVDSSLSNPELTVCWKETGIRVNGEPARKGFGHTVLTRLARQSLNAEIDLTFKNRQLAWTVKIPSDHFRPE